MLIRPKNRSFIKTKNYEIIHKMSKEIIAIGNIVVTKHKFPQCKSPVLINDVDINKIVVSNRFPFGKKLLNILQGMKMVRKLDLYA